MDFPTIDINKVQGLTEFETEVLNKIIVKGKLRKSAPKVRYQNYTCEQYKDYGDGLKCYVGEYRLADEADGYAKYVWRMLCFYLIPYQPHSCMPFSCEFDLPTRVDDAPLYHKIIRERADKLVNKVLAPVSILDERGANRWRNALFGTNLPTF